MGIRVHSLLWVMQDLYHQPEVVLVGLETLQARALEHQTPQPTEAEHHRLRAFEVGFRA